MDRNQSLSDRLFSQQTDAVLQRHIHSNSGLKQQPLHSTATKEHKRLVKEEALFKFITPETSTSLVEGQCLRAKLPDTVNVAIQIGGKQVHERYATKQNDFDEKKFNQLINYLDPRPEYIRVIIIEWSTKSSIFIARIISADIQCSLLSARRCEGLDGYSQQVDWFNIRKTQITFFHRGT
ncbi:unnamed protein product [Rotaria socialis]|uniref:Uncharacterized protein n=1 Tax=Rotaria socialis TaxID=392032 RepID=A0A818E0T2_9BILA|nr:unnamed protein product [Rotaria socialis]CAF4426365.1 unnamed protein product [Rotaria socialis]CAF4484806.1 unnamed protein product [Rotaria socialis]